MDLTLNAKVIVGWIADFNLCCCIVKCKWNDPIHSTSVWNAGLETVEVGRLVKRLCKRGDGTPRIFHQKGSEKRPVDSKLIWFCSIFPELCWCARGYIWTFKNVGTSFLKSGQLHTHWKFVESKLSGYLKNAADSLILENYNSIFFSCYLVTINPYGKGKPKAQFFLFTRTIK